MLVLLSSLYTALLCVLTGPCPHVQMPVKLQPGSNQPSKHLCLTPRPETVFRGANIGLAHRNRPKPSNIGRQRGLDTGIDQSSLKCMHPSLEQTELQTAHDSLELPVSIREDGEVFFFSALHYRLSPDG